MQYYLSTLHTFCSNDIGSIVVSRVATGCAAWYSVAQQIRNFAAANILNLILLARALIFNLSEARLGEAARARGDHGHSWGTGKARGPVLTLNLTESL